MTYIAWKRCAAISCIIWWLGSYSAIGNIEFNCVRFLAKFWVSDWLIAKVTLGIWYKGNTHINHVIQKNLDQSMMHEYAIDVSCLWFHGNWQNSYYYHQLAVEGLPEVPTTVSEEISEKLDLPDVPTKGPDTGDAEVKRKGISSSLCSSPSLL